MIGSKLLVNEVMDLLTEESRKKNLEHNMCVKVCVVKVNSRTTSCDGIIINSNLDSMIVNTP